MGVVVVECARGAATISIRKKVSVDLLIGETQSYQLEEAWLRG
jgi:hypothetical protein